VLHISGTMFLAPCTFNVAFYVLRLGKMQIFNTFMFAYMCLTGEKLFK